MRHGNNVQIDFDRNLNPEDKNEYLNFIDRSDEATFANNYFTFNAEGLKNHKNAIEYEMIFKKNAYVMVNDTRLTSDKEVLLN